MSTTATGVAAAVTEARQRKEPTETDPKPEMEEVEINPGVILDARREVRAKLYMGQVCLGFYFRHNLLPIMHIGSDGLDVVRPCVPSSRQRNRNDN